MILERIATGILGVVFLVAYLVWKWKCASDASDAMAAERLAARQSFEQLKRDPRFHHLQQYLATKYRTAFEPSPDSATYRIAYVGLMDGGGQALLAPNGAGARYLVAYLERGDKPTRIQAALDLQSGTVGEAELGWMGWSSVVPAMDG